MNEYFLDENIDLLEAMDLYLEADSNYDINEISKFEQKHGKLPDSYKEFVMSGKSIYKYQVKETIPQHRDIDEIRFRKFNDSDSGMMYINGLWYNKYKKGFINIGNNDFGDDLYMNIKSGKVIFKYHELDNNEEIVLGNSFDEFIGNIRPIFKK